MIFSIIIIIIIRFRQYQVNYRSSVAYQDNYPLYIYIVYKNITRFSLIQHYK